MIRRSTLITLLVLAALVAFTFYLQRTKDETGEVKATPTEPSPLVFTFESEITGFRLEKVGAGVIELGKDEAGTWKMTYPIEGETDVSAVESAVSQMLSTRAISSLQDGPSLQEAGLAPPNFRLLLILKDGKQERISIGDESPTGSGYYVQVGSTGMFVVNKFSLDPILEFGTQPPYKPTPTSGTETPAPGAEGEPSSAGSLTPAP